MQLSNAPGKLLLPFANAGAKNTIPTASQIGITAGAASLTDGFPPLTRTPIAAGGVPPSGLDMNGILYALSAALRWANAGGGYVYDGTFAADINVGGYPKGARVLRSDGAGYWLNTIDSNTVDPESVTVNAAQVAGWVPDLTNGIAAITMTNANVTLTPAQYGKPFIVLSGVLTANLNLIFPNLAGEWTVVNNCTGAFTVTAKTAAGTGAVVTPGRTRIIWGDGTNIAGAMNEVETPAQFDNSTKLATTAFIKRQGIAFAFQINISATTTLTAAAHVGALIRGNASSAITLTLPLSSTVAAGGCIAFQNAGTVATTISRQGSDVIYVAAGGNNTITVLPGEFVTLETDGFNWTASGTGVLGFAGSFGSSLAASGYQKLPSGFIIQWGSIPSAASATTNALFPITFPGGAPFQVLASGYNISGGVQAYVTVNDATASGCAFNAFYANAGGVAPSLAGAGQVLIKYIAIGK